MLCILSNINCDPIIRKIKRQHKCLDSVGYGNILADLLDPNSTVNLDLPDEVFILVDLAELIALDNDYQQKIDDFFCGMDTAIKDSCQYFISDGYYFGATECDYSGQGICRQSVQLWNQKLYELCYNKKNIHVFPFCKLVETVGAKHFFANKTWYMGGIRYSLDGINAICHEIDRIEDIVSGNVKKVLALDLDNTLWGGVAGEDGLSGIKLADSGIGKCYKEFQQVVRLLQKAGVILALVSKNNEQDALEIIDQHPHMLLRSKDFVAQKINWDNKSENIKRIAEELNVGLESMVFIDDNPVEREEVKVRLPEVIVPDFPDTPEKLIQFGNDITEKYFSRIAVTKEDTEKTAQYIAKKSIENLKNTFTDFNDFLRNMKIRLIQRDPSENMDRLSQLILKTNQFNTTVTRYTRAELEEMSKSPLWKIYFYEVEDKFTNHGLCAAAILKLGELPTIYNFVMSCRVMGRNIEYGILDAIEQDLIGMGYAQVSAIFRYGPKNAPVEMLYDRAQYIANEKNDVEKVYSKELNENGSNALFIGEIEGY